MHKRVLHKKIFGQIFLNLMLILTLLLSTSTPVLASETDVLSEIRSLLQNQYVNPVANDILDAPTVEEMLDRLGDPHTMYFSPEEYQKFKDSIDQRFYGIGIHINMEPEGLRVVSVISGSPAEEVGLKAGDLIVSADGHSLAGLSSDAAVSILRGLDGSTVQISVKQRLGTKDYAVKRREVSEPTVTGKVLDGHIGYLDLNSFGTATPTEFQNVINNLKSQKVDGWIVDLRDNGGGYLSAALDLAGYFIGPDIVMQIKDRSGDVEEYEAADHGFTLNQPIVFLINENSASASEILSATVKDHKKALLVGSTTYGKGTVQSMFPLSDGGVLKMTVDHFYSPLGHEIDQIGVDPDVEIQKTDPLKVAELMLMSKWEALGKARTQDYWEAWGELTGFLKNQQAERYAYYYPDYLKVSQLSGVPLDKRFTVHFNGAVDWQSVNSSSLELINSQTGERLTERLETLGPSDLQVIPSVPLEPDTTYWLVIHPEIKDVKGLAMSKGGVGVVQTITEPDSLGSLKTQSLGIAKFVSKSTLKRAQDPQYGYALWDLGPKP